MNRNPAIASMLALAVGFSGCAVGPNHETPPVATPSGFRNGPEAAAASAANVGWWEMYRDPTLQALVREALAKNHDLRIAAARVEQSRQITIQARSYYLPSFGVAANAARGQNQVSGNPVFNSDATTDTASAVINAVWEIDVWGRLRRLNESAQARYLATEEGRNAVVLSLVGDVAQVYFELLELDLELSIARRTTESFARSSRIFDQRREGGVASRLETARADAAYAQAAASIPEIERQIAVKENQLSILLGRPPGAIPRATVLGEGLVPPDVPAGLPADLVARRPDLRAAEHVVRAANAEIGASIAEYFPKIGLTALLGRVSPDLSDLSHNGTTWSVAGAVAGPLFQWGRVRAQVGASRAFWDEARTRYEQSVLIAFGEVANALVAREKLAAVREQQSHAVDALTGAVEISIQRYLNGKASYYEVLEAQQQLFPSENALARTQLNELLASVQLYKALGGGWQPEPTQTPPPPPGK